jgi:magnesium transporter
MSDTAAVTGATGELRLSSDGKPLRCLVLRHGRVSQPPANLADLSEILKEDDALVWFDVVDPGPRDLTLCQEEFNLHPLAIEDAVMAHERPKIEAYGSYWFVVIHATTLTSAGVAFHEMAVFAGQRFVVTVRHEPAYAMDEIERRWLAHPQPLRRDAGFLLYTILDTVVDGYFPVAESLQDRVDDLEATLFARQPLGNEVLVEIFSMKQHLQQFRRAVLPLRDILNPLIRGDLALFAEEEIAYYRDVYDHAVRVIDQVDAVRDLVNSALEIHLSVVANRQNEISKQLTLIATIFLPLSFLTGFFGQNFGYMVSRIAGGAAFWGLGIGSQVLALVGLVIFFKVKKWF